MGELYAITWPPRRRGTRAAADLVDALSTIGILQPYIDHNPPPGKVARAWQEKISRGLADGDLPVLRQLTIRAEASLFASHPAPGRRYQVLLGAEWNASAATVGLRRTRVLMIGLPLFLCLRPQERVALLGHEMGHFADGDLRTSLLTRPALETFGILADLFYPSHGARGRGDDGFGLVIYLAELVLKPLLYLASCSFFVLHRRWSCRRRSIQPAPRPGRTGPAGAGTATPGTGPVTRTAAPETGPPPMICA